MPSPRQSNMELLRIIAMLMILMLHFNANAYHLNVFGFGSGLFSWNTIEGHLIESFCISAVNVFVLISGYFAIKLSVYSVLNLYIRCFIIGMVTYMLYVALVGESISLNSVAGRFLAFSHNHWWFVISYIGLMAISPILNAGCKALNKRTYSYVLILFSFVMLYFGWWKHMEMTHDGYSLIHFIYLYIIARYIKLHVDELIILRLRWWWLAIYVLICMALTGCQQIAHRSMYSYDNPLIIMAAISLLLFFLSIPFQNRFVNWVAVSIFSAYLIQESPYLGKLWLYPCVESVFANGICGGGGDIVRRVDSGDYDCLGYGRQNLRYAGY